MGEIIEKRRRNYSGLDADRLTIPAGGKAVGDTYLATDFKIQYFWSGVAWIIIPVDVIVAGMISAGAIETLKIKDLNVTAGKLAADSCETLKIKDLNVTVGKLAGGITAAKLATDSVETLKIKDLNVTAGKLAADSCETLKIKDLNVTVGKLAGGITATKLAADCVETAKIKDLNVTKAKAELGFGRYVPREVPAIDFAIGNFGVKDAWQVDGLNLTGIVPVGAIAVHLGCKVRGNAANLAFGLRANATTKAYNSIELTVQVANVYTHWVDFVCYLDADRLLDYLHQTGLDSIGVNVLGWYI